MMRALREANWLTPDRARAWSLMFAIATAALLLLALGWVAASGGRATDPAGRPIGTDFASFHAAAALALSGRPEAAYNIAAHAAAQWAETGATEHYFAFFYPPTFLLVLLPLGTLPYLTALAAWLVLTGGLYAAALRALAGRALPGLVAFAFPAVLMNAGHGQNALLSAALFRFAAAFLDRRPAVAGICIGLLCYKPHLAILAPVALAASGRWRAFVAAAATVAGMVVLSALVFGIETWRGFVAGAPLATATLEQGLVGAEKMVSTFAAVRLLGGGLTLAYAAQGVMALVAAILLARAARSADGAALGALLAAAATLVSPFLVDYDLAILAVPLVWAFAQAQRTGFLPWEKVVLGAAFLLPVLARGAATLLWVPIGPIVCAALFAMAFRRAALRQKDSRTS
jgi:hypothetical protein